MKDHRLLFLSNIFARISSKGYGNALMVREESLNNLNILPSIQLNIYDVPSMNEWLHGLFVFKDQLSYKESVYVSERLSDRSHWVSTASRVEDSR